jgi:hypothetical protein
VELEKWVVGTAFCPGCSRFPLPRYQEAELALTSTVGGGSAAAKLAEFAETCGAAECLLGVVLLRTNRRKDAAVMFRSSLDINPYMWSAYRHLCEMGESIGELREKKERSWLSILFLHRTSARGRHHFQASNSGSWSCPDVN